MKSINPNIYPKGGHFYEERDGARIFGPSWNGVIERVKRYRQRNGIPLDKTEEEVIAQACSRNPSLCTADDGGVREVQLKATSMKSRILLWIIRMRKRKTEDSVRYVSDEDYKKRADICAQCPRNKPVQGGCSSCTAALKEGTESILGSRWVDGRLNGCEVLGEYLKISAALDEQSEVNDKLPGNCWRKRTL